MTRTGWCVLFLVALVAIGLWLRQPPTPDPVVEQERAADSARVADALTDANRARLLAEAWQDSADVHREQEAAYKASADQKAARIAYLMAHPTVIAPSVTPGYTGPPLPVTVDSAASCEERFQIRTSEALDLRAALSECDRAAAAQQLRADSMATANGRLARALQQSDSARRAEIARPRPCRRDWVVAHPSCGTADAITFAVGFGLGVAVSR